MSAGSGDTSMSGAPPVRRADKLMAEAAVRELLARGYSGRLGTVGPDGWPYVVPLLYLWRDGEIWVHGTRARGHLRASVDHEPRVCFQVDEPGEVFPYGRFECDTSVAYRSVVVFGRLRLIEDRERKTAFFDALMAKYGDPAWGRPRGFYPRLDEVTVYAIAVARMTGKETALPAPPDRWPRVDHTKSPGAGSLE
jgi:nitroimidazol reductase NimA-like FMN-containing flavoprotein (pyridoxamine 5'-phosphate oxidase superfamily)